MRTSAALFTAAALIAAGGIAAALLSKDAAQTPLPQNGSDQPPAVETPVVVVSPKEGETVSSPLRVEGQARGTWYFEASFPIEILDASGRRLGISHAQAQNEWMTESFVPFVGTVSFSAPSTDTGTLVLHKDNPSGLPEHDAQVRIPVKFSTAQRTTQLFYYDADADKDASGNPRCLTTSVRAVSRSVPATQTPVQDAIRLLLKGELTAQERQSGLSTEFPLDGLELKGAAIKSGVLTLEFDDPQHKTSGGACRASILRGQIEATAKQFPEVKSVRIIPADLFQP